MILVEIWDEMSETGEENPLLSVGERETRHMVLGRKNNGQGK